jgi:hypothetical protein
MTGIGQEGEEVGRSAAALRPLERCPHGLRVEEPPYLRLVDRLGERVGGKHVGQVDQGAGDRRDRNAVVLGDVVAHQATDPMEPYTRRRPAAGAGADGDVDERRVASPNPPQVGGRAMAHHCIRPAGEYGGQAAALHRHVRWPTA